MAKKTIHSDYSNPEVFWEAMESAYKNPATAFTDKKILTNKLIAKKINETAWKRLGGYRYLGDKPSFYYNLESRLASIYLKMIRRESVANQVYANIRDFLRISVEERKGKTERNNQNISDQQQPILALGDMTSGSYGAFHNRADWLKINRSAVNETQTSEGILDYFERDEKGQLKKDTSGKPIKREIPALAANWKILEERGGEFKFITTDEFMARIRGEREGFSKVVGYENIIKLVADWLTSWNFWQKWGGEKPQQLMIGLLGDPGLGKTYISQAIGKALGNGYYRISLNGKNSSSIIYGNSIDNPGAEMGGIVKAIAENKSQFTVVFFWRNWKSG